MIIDKYSTNGKVAGQIELNDSVFRAEINTILIYEMIKAANSNTRQGTHCTKEKSFIRGGGAKPWRQKGTGRARQGSIRSAQWRGGGTVFGPWPRSYRIELPKKIKKDAYRSILSLKAKEGVIKVVEDFSIESGKTRDMVKIGNALDVKKGLLLTTNDEVLFKRAVKNIPWLRYNNVARLSSRDIYYSRTLLITEGAVKYLNEKYAKGE